MKPINDVLRQYRDAKKILMPFLDVMVKHEAIGVENIPKKGRLILIANHRSDLDPLIISAHVPRFMVWVAANYTFKIPLAGRLLESLGTIPISEDKREQMRAFKDVAKVLKNERILGIFPEGDEYIRKNDFSKHVGRFHSGFAHFAVRFRSPVLPACVIGIEEKVEPIPVPKFIREFLGFPKKVLDVKNRLHYKRALVVFGDPIAIEPYLDKPQEEAIPKLVEEAKQAVLDLLFRYAPVERRKDPARKSGARITPEEVIEGRLSD